jgi:hypothetical protein
MPHADSPPWPSLNYCNLSVSVSGGRAWWHCRLLPHPPPATQRTRRYRAAFCYAHGSASPANCLGGEVLSAPLTCDMATNTGSDTNYGS